MIENLSRTCLTTICLTQTSDNGDQQEMEGVRPDHHVFLHSDWLNNGMILLIYALPFVATSSGLAGVGLTSLPKFCFTTVH